MVPTWAPSTCAATVCKHSPGPTMTARSRPVLVLFDYVPPVSGALRALKFHGDPCPAQASARCLQRPPSRGRRLVARRAAWVTHGVPSCRVALTFYLLVPVPLHPDRLHQRGYNQAARLAAQAARWLGRPVAPRLLQRCRATAPQTSSSRQTGTATSQARVLGGPGWLASPARSATSPWSMTCPATAEAAAAALRRAGIETVSIWAVARPMSAFFTATATPD